MAHNLRAQRDCSHNCEVALVITKNQSEIGLNWFFPKKKFSDCVELPMSLPPAPPEEGTLRAFSVEKTDDQNAVFF